MLQECPSGWVQPTSGKHNKQSCTRCGAGKYEDYPERCTTCVVGQFSTAGSASCNTCAVNEYQDSEGGTGCKACPNGWSTFSLKGQSKCEAICPDGAVTDVNYQSCFCDDGKHLCKHESSGKEACMVRFKKKLLLLVVSSLFMFFLI